MPRERRRYIAFKTITSDINLNKGKVISLVLNEFLKLFGEYEGAKASLYIVEYDSDQGTGILKVNLKSFRKAMATLASIRYDAGKDIKFEILGVSGTIRRCKKKFLTYTKSKSHDNENIKIRTNK
ncbi:MAG: Rpp14/Pop5 family protein [Candidatus Asgardarchaeia archaeon]